MRSGAAARYHGLRSARGGRQPAARDRRRGGSRGRLPPRARHRARITRRADRARRGAGDGGGPVEAAADARARDRGAAALRGIAQAVRQLPVQQGAARRRSRPTSGRRSSSRTIRRIQQPRRRLPVCRRLRQGGRRVLALARHRAAARQLLEHRHRAVLPRPIRARRRRCSARRPNSRRPTIACGAILPMPCCSTAARPRPEMPTPARSSWPRASSPSIRNMASTRRRRRTMRLGCGTGTGPGSASRAPWPKGTATTKCTTTSGWPRSGSATRRGAVAHVRRARELGYPEAFLKSAPELRRHPEQDLTTGRTNMPDSSEHRQRPWAGRPRASKSCAADRRTMTRPRMARKRPLKNPERLAAGTLTVYLRVRTAFPFEVTGYARRHAASFTVEGTRRRVVRIQLAYGVGDSIVHGQSRARRRRIPIIIIDRH